MKWTGYPRYSDIYSIFHGTRMKGSNHQHGLAIRIKHCKYLYNGYWKDSRDRLLHSLPDNSCVTQIGTAKNGYDHGLVLRIWGDSLEIMLCAPLKNVDDHQKQAFGPLDISEPTDENKLPIFKFDYDEDQTMQEFREGITGNNYRNPSDAPFGTVGRLCGNISTQHKSLFVYGRFRTMIAKNKGLQRNYLNYSDHEKDLIQALKKKDSRLIRMEEIVL